jgi:hypothetical protein
VQNGQGAFLRPLSMADRADGGHWQPNRRRRGPLGASLVCGIGGGGRGGHEEMLTHGGDGRGTTGGESSTAVGGGCSVGGGSSVGGALVFLQ